MTDYMNNLEKRMAELTVELQKKIHDPAYNYDNLDSIDMLIKFIVYLKNDSNLSDGLYIYVNEENEIVNAEYFVKEEDEITVIRLDDEQLEIVIELFKDVFTINVE